MSEARAATAWTCSALAFALIGVALMPVSTVFFLLVIAGAAVAWGCGFWCAKAKGYSRWLGLLGPLVVVVLPDLNPVFEEIRRHERAAEHDRETGP